MKNLKTIRKENDRDALLRLNEKIRTEFNSNPATKINIETFKLSETIRNSSGGYSTKFIKINGHTVTNISVDQYCNLSCSINKIFPVAYLEIFGKVIVDLIEPEMGHAGRSMAGLHIRFFERHGFGLSKTCILTMFKTGKGDRNDRSEQSAFKEWLIGDSYCSGGNLPDNHHLSKEDLQ